MLSSKYPGISQPQPTVESMHNTVLELKEVVETLVKARGNMLNHAVTFQDLLDRNIITQAQLNTNDNRADNSIAELAATIPPDSSADVAALQADVTTLEGDVTTLDGRVDTLEAKFPVAVADGGTGQTTAAEAIGELTQALTEDTSPDRIVDMAAVYDNSADTGKKVALYNVAGIAVLAKGSVSAGSSLDLPLDNTGYSNFKTFKLFLQNVVPATDNTDLFVRFSDDGGGTFEADATDYQWSFMGAAESSISNFTGDNSDSEITVFTGLGNASGEGLEVEITIYHPAASTKTRVVWAGMYNSSATAAHWSFTGGGNMTVAGASTDVRVIMSSGNISCDYTLIGIE